jgi:hypothetical protein
MTTLINDYRALASVQATLGTEPQAPTADVEMSETAETTENVLPNEVVAGIDRLTDR